MDVGETRATPADAQGVPPRGMDVHTAQLVPNASSLQSSSVRRLPPATPDDLLMHPFSGLRNDGLLPHDALPLGAPSTGGLGMLDMELSEPLPTSSANWTRLAHESPTASRATHAQLAPAKRRRVPLVTTPAYGPESPATLDAPISPLDLARAVVYTRQINASIVAQCAPEPRRPLFKRNTAPSRKRDEIHRRIQQRRDSAMRRYMVAVYGKHNHPRELRGRRSHIAMARFRYEALLSLDALATAYRSGVISAADYDTLTTPLYVLDDDMAPDDDDPAELLMPFANAAGNLVFPLSPAEGAAACRLVGIDGAPLRAVIVPKYGCADLVAAHTAAAGRIFRAGKNTVLAARQRRYEATDDELFRHLGYGSRYMPNSRLDDTTPLHPAKRAKTSNSQPFAGQFVESSDGNQLRRLVRVAPVRLPWFYAIAPECRTSDYADDEPLVIRIIARRHPIVATEDDWDRFSVPIYSYSGMKRHHGGQWSGKSSASKSQSKSGEGRTPRSSRATRKAAKRHQSTRERQHARIVRRPVKYPRLDLAGCLMPDGTKVNATINKPRGPHPTLPGAFYWQVQQGRISLFNGWMTKEEVMDRILKLCAGELEPPPPPKSRPREPKRVKQQRLRAEKARKRAEALVRSQGTAVAAPRFAIGDLAD
ncbi:uncharacterized protein AMSG_11889 [Thecamonas trahens ATCC 50062]|uniref:Uncharacterized protein n=1 Tax=Thecamonas trahens ATCC 50062 TaxID=461836 RepID=A0A0L0DB31_THETB|nr:hypothetical protein AMSG_11889 [Thecamonas trahens ATCC 50062]KNC49537.1 hypothetical protein AMSG_11889 [Thecamonas trahens ATCC 50062]|eukprot:XP_013757763.1 hypothetical protein AMSG_11889 [Thecamonas trahens ATCC 50062]